VLLYFFQIEDRNALIEDTEGSDIRDDDATYVTRQFTARRKSSRTLLKRA
jgi:hypothetical protein